MEGTLTLTEILPLEITEKILENLDQGNFVKTARVCKIFAHLVFSTKRILSPKFYCLVPINKYKKARFSLSLADVDIASTSFPKLVSISPEKIIECSLKNYIPREKFGEYDFVTHLPLMVNLKKLKFVSWTSISYLSKLTTLKYLEVKSRVFDLNLETMTNLEVLKTNSQIFRLPVLPKLKKVSLFLTTNPRLVTNMTKALKLAKLDKISVKSLYIHTSDWSILCYDFVQNLSLTFSVDFIGTSLEYSSTKLTSLSLTDCKNFKSVNLKHLNLKKLELVRVKATDEDIEHMKGLTSLTLTSAGITKSPSKILRKLNLSGDECFLGSSLAELKDLTKLDLSKNVTVNGQFLEPLTGLTNLNLSSNYLVEYCHITKMSKLKILKMKNTKMTTTNFEELIFLEKVTK